MCSLKVDNLGYGATSEEVKSLVSSLLRAVGLPSRRA
jgi:hypothetical protein